MTPEIEQQEECHRQLAALMPRLESERDFRVVHVNGSEVIVSMSSECFDELLKVFPNASRLSDDAHRYGIDRADFDRAVSEKLGSYPKTTTTQEDPDTKTAMDKVHALLKDDAVRKITRVTINENGETPTVEIRINTKDPGQWRSTAAAWRVQLPLSKREKAWIPDKPNDNFVLIVPLDRIKGWSVESCQELKGRG